MRLLNVSTLELEEFYGAETPKYAILSHTWGKTEITKAELEAINQHRQAQKQQHEHNQQMAMARTSQSPPSLPTISSFGTAADRNKAEAVRMMLLSSMLAAMRNGRTYTVNYGVHPHHSHHGHDRSRSITDGLDEPSSDYGSEDGHSQTHDHSHDHQLERRRQEEEEEEERALREREKLMSRYNLPMPVQQPGPVMPAITPHPLELKPGYTKILSAAKQALSDGIQYLWADTICIDRTNGYEISEAINAMFTWYSNAAVCYAHLEDVVFQEYKSGYRTWEHDFAESRWFTRGWTLQELVAPKKVVFFAKGWQWLGTKADSTLSKVVEKVTKIEAKVLSDPGQIFRTCIARRMAWASARKTTRPEDIAYSLMGIFGVNMQLLYGEGGENAFVRLQEEIIKTSDDHTLFAWGLVGSNGKKEDNVVPTHYDSLEEFDHDEMVGMTGILARSPADFAGMDGVVPATTTMPEGDASYKMTNKGLKIRLKLSPVNIGHVTNQKFYLGVLNCQHSEDDPSSRLGMLLTETETPNVLFRTRTKMYTWLSGAALATAEPKTIYICQNNPARLIQRDGQLDELFWIKARDLVSPGYQIVDIQARRGHWNREFSTLRATGIEISGGGKKGSTGAVVVYQLAVLTFWNKHMRRVFHIRVLVDGSSRTYFVDLCQPSSQSSGQGQRQQKEVRNEMEELKWIKGEAKRIWENPGQIRVISSGRGKPGELKQTKMVDIANPDTYGTGSEESGPSSASGWGENTSWEVVLDQGFSSTVTFTEAWEKEYMRTVRASVEKRKDVVVLEVSSMLWEAAPVPVASKPEAATTNGAGVAVAV